MTSNRLHTETDDGILYVCLLKKILNILSEILQKQQSLLKIITLLNNVCKRLALWFDKIVAEIKKGKMHE